MKTATDKGEHSLYATELQEIRKGWESTLPDVDASPLPLFVRIALLANLYGSFFDRLLKPFQITRAEYETLGILRSTGSSRHSSPTELAAFAGQSTAGMTKTLDRLERAGLAERRSHPSDRRRVEVAISRKGAALADRIFRSHMESLHSLLEGLGRSKRDAVNSNLEELINRFTDMADGGGRAVA